ncbi:MAG: hydroxysqualene dehydroxylase HpnE [Gaiellaceae bacterium]
MRFAVVGGGLAGLAAALELVDRGHDVTVHEARRTLGGAVQTLPAREGDPSPPPDNGQHIALGCFSEYLRFLARIGEGGSVLRRPLELPVFDEHGRVAMITASPASILRYSHLPPRERLGLLRALLRLRSAQGSDDESFGELLGRLGQSPGAVDRFWDVFVRPALNLPSAEVSAALGAFTVRTGLLSGRAASELVLPVRPLGWMHGHAAGSALQAAGATVRTHARVESLEELDVDGIVVALPPAESARLLGEPESQLEDSPIVSVHLLFDRTLLRRAFGALIDSPAHWVFDRGALTGHPPERGQYLTVVSSGVPDLLEVRGRELVELMAGELTARFGEAEVLWSRVSREPRATVALRPGTSSLRSATKTDRRRIVRAGAWIQTGWPATMESAVRSGRAAASRVVFDLTTRVAA